LSIREGLARLDIRTYTDHEFDTLPHVFLTSELEWDPSVLDQTFTDFTEWGKSDDNDNDLFPNKLFDAFGYYRQRVSVNHLAYFQRQDGSGFEDIIDKCVLEAHSSDHIYCNAVEVEDLLTTIFEDDHTIHEPFLNKPVFVNKKYPDYKSLQRLFGWIAPDIIKKPFEHTTQYTRLPSGTVLKRSFKSPNPALNIARRNEAVACDIVYAHVPAISNGSAAYVLFVGTDSQVTEVYGIKTD
jgi:hypothetical protein